MAEHLPTELAVVLPGPEPSQEVVDKGEVTDGSLGPTKKTGGRPKSFVWQYYTQVSDANNSSKRCRVVCKACGADFLSRVEQMEAHLAHHCPKCELGVKEMMRARIITAKNLAKTKKEASQKESALMATASAVQAATPCPAPLPKRQKVDDLRDAQPSTIPVRLRYPQVVVPAHPLVAHWLAVCRNKQSPPPIFRNAVAELGRILIYEAANEWLPTVNGQVETPLGIADCVFVDPSKPVKVVPILRGGTVLLEQAATVLPTTETYHVGHVRDEITLQTNMYLNKLPVRFAPDDRILLSDPMIATGGTCLDVLAELVARGASQEYIRIITVLVAPPALENISKQFPGSRIFAGMIDAGVNEHGYIVPGLGDAADRAFGTL